MAQRLLKSFTLANDEDVETENLERIKQDFYNNLSESEKQKIGSIHNLSIECSLCYDGKFDELFDWSHYDVFIFAN